MPDSAVLTAIDGLVSHARVQLEARIGAHLARHAGHRHFEIAELGTSPDLQWTGEAADAVDMVLAGAVVPCPETPPLLGSTPGEIAEAFKRSEEDQIVWLWGQVLAVCGADPQFASDADAIWVPSGATVHGLIHAVNAMGL